MRRALIHHERRAWRLTGDILTVQQRAVIDPHTLEHIELRELIERHPEPALRIHHRPDRTIVSMERGVARGWGGWRRWWWRGVEVDW